MTLKIAFSGAAGSGKTTMMNVLKSSQFIQDVTKEIGEIQFLPEVVRTLKAEHDFKINEHGTLETELIVLSAHLQNLLLKDRFVSDRCLVDNYIYSCLNKNPLPPEYVYFNDWLVDQMISRYDLIFYIPNEFVPPEDGVRNTSKEYHEKTQEVFERNYSFYRNDFPDKIVTLRGDITTRFEIIKENIQRVLENKKKEPLTFTAI